MRDFNHKAALITGGSSGIGFSLAKQLVGFGSNVWILGRRLELLESATIELQKNKIHDDQAIGFIQADVSKVDDIGPILSGWMDKEGCPDLLINSAGVSRPGLFLELPNNIFEEMMAINYFGTVNITRLILPGMLKRASGYIVNISSVAGFLGTYGYSAYGASKFAVRGFSDVLRSELISTNIGMTVVFPPDTKTPQLAGEEEFKPRVTKELSKSAGVLEPDFVAGKILKAVRKNSYICTPGLESSFLFALSNILGRYTYSVMDMMVRDAIKKTKLK
ncbi:MAG: SDR family oxidoreductase [Anaerolineae bacterium]|nr:SDR family oxidoreductase [Anaerolineae bacterium]